MNATYIKENVIYAIKHFSQFMTLADPSGFIVMTAGGVINGTH
jgi:hypothetical protein